jgi:hypothetical protein
MRSKLNMTQNVINRIICGALFTALICCAPAFAQTRPQDGGHEIQIWAGGAPFEV